MIIFEKIRWKNLLSTGNVFTEIDLSASPHTLIMGKNGSGKSTLLDALCFVLFGKPYRNINKPQIVNSINTKELLVELNFSVGTKKYTVSRGIKPNIFKITLDGVELNQDAATRDQQEFLERMVLKMNYKSFTQIVILGSSSFTPFMQLSAADRRAVIEDLLDIQIFSNMNVIVKNKLNYLKDEMNELKIRLEATKEKIDLHKKHMESVKVNTNKLIEDKESKVLESKHILVEFETGVKDYQSKIEALQETISDESALKNKFNSLLGYESRIGGNLQKTQKEKVFFKTNTQCPTCNQKINGMFRDLAIHECTEKAKALQDGLTKLNEEKSGVVEKLNTIHAVNKEIISIGQEIANAQTSMMHTRKYIDVLQKEIDGLRDTKEETHVENSQALYDELTDYLSRRQNSMEEKSYYDVAAQLLKDSGIKTKIIKQYLPIINKVVNKYLTQMEFFVNFNINEEFKETILSRHRDDFSYANFSEGEKQKIDLALMLTWRAIARMKNSVSTNLLILDETFDSSLDNDGTEALLEILRTLPENTNVFVISHKNQLNDKFASSFTFEKHNNFSRIAS